MQLTEFDKWHQNRSHTHTAQRNVVQRNASVFRTPETLELLKDSSRKCNKVLPHKNRRLTKIAASRKSPPHKKCHLTSFHLEKSRQEKKFRAVSFYFTFLPLLSLFASIRPHELTLTLVHLVFSTLVFFSVCLCVCLFTRLPNHLFCLSVCVYLTIFKCCSYAKLWKWAMIHNTHRLIIWQ